MRRWSIATKLLAIQLGIVFVVGAVTVPIAWVQHRADLERITANRALSIAVTLADTPFVVDAVQSANPASPLQPYASQVTKDTSVDFIAFMSTDRTLFTGTPAGGGAATGGSPYPGDIQPALAGKTFAETLSTSTGLTVRAIAPIFADGHVVAAVAVAITVTAFDGAFAARLLPLGVALIAMLALALLVPWTLQRNLPHPAPGPRRTSRRR